MLLAALISDDLPSKFALVGSPAALLEHAQPLYGRCAESNLTPHGLDAQHGICLLGESSSSLFSTPKGFDQIVGNNLKPTYPPWRATLLPLPGVATDLS
jgi:hypothetical protein